MIKKILNFYLLSLFVIFPVFVSAGSSNVQADNKLKERDIINITKPSVVQIGQHITGSIIVANVDVDLNTLKLKPIQGNTIETKLDRYYVGSGFFVNPDGYIITSSHLVSLESVKSQILKGIISSDFTKKILDGSYKDTKEIQKNSKVKLEDFRNSVYAYLMKNSIFSLKSKTTVIDPKTSYKNIETAIDNGFSVDVVSSNNDFPNGGKGSGDIAILKIKKQYLPALPVLQPENIGVGTKIYVVGFSGNTQVKSGDFPSSVFTAGLVGSRERVNGNLVWKIDTNIPESSIGGPVLNESGDVIGAVGFSDGVSNSMFIVPYTAIKEILKKAGIKNKEGNFGFLFRDALLLKQQRRCKDAIIKFESAKGTLSFVDSSVYVDEYISECEKLIKEGGSVDTGWDKFIEWLKNVDLAVWVMSIISIIIVVAFSFVVVFLKKRLKEEQEEIKGLEDIVVKDHYKEEFGKDISLEKAEEENARNVSSAESELIKYIKSAKESGIDNDTIKKELKKAGWGTSEIEKTFNLAK